MDSDNSRRVVLLRRVAGEGALVAAAGATLSLVLNDLAFEATANLLGARGMYWAFGVVFWIITVASLTVVAGWIIGWIAVEPLWVRGLIPVGFGVIAWWGWQYLSREFDLWGVNRYLATTEELSSGWAQISAIAVVTDLVVNLLAIGLLAWGGLRILRAEAPADQPELVEV
jgi:hypothetical protein